MRRASTPLLLLAVTLVACNEYDLAAKTGDPDGIEDTAGTAGDPGVGTGFGGTDDPGLRDIPRSEPGEGPLQNWPRDDTGGGGGDDTGTRTGEDDICDIASRVAGYLDEFQTPDDGRVIFCHRSGGPNFNEIDTSISSCMPHLDHEYDVFPSTLCDS